MTVCSPTIGTTMLFIQEILGDGNLRILGDGVDIGSPICSNTACVVVSLSLSGVLAMSTYSIRVACGVSSVVADELATENRDSELSGELWK